MYYGATTSRIHDIRSGGLVSALDPAELGDHQAADLDNLDISRDGIHPRGGTVTYNTIAPNASVPRGMGVYYPPDGTDRSLLIASGASVFADMNRDGDFADAGEEIASAVAGVDDVDFIQHRGDLFFGSKAAGLYVWSGSGSATAAVLPTPPAGPPTVTRKRTDLETFNSGAWTSTAGALTTSYVSDIARSGNSLKVTATGGGARGAFVHKAWSAGATVDLSTISAVSVWVYSESVGVSYQIGVYKNGAVLGSDPDFTLFPSFLVQTRKSWTRIEIPLGSIAESDRTESPGLAIRFVDDGGAGFNTSLWFDNSEAVGNLPPGDYKYYYTYANVTAGGVVTSESRAYTPAGSLIPTPAEITIESDAPAAGVNVSVTAGGTASNIHIYRYREDGPFSTAYRVAQITNTTQTWVDTVSEGTIAETNPPSLDYYRISPPAATTYALVGGRLFAAGVDYAYRVYVSRSARPLEFSSVESPSEFGSGGWFDLPSREPVVRIIEFDGAAIIFTPSSVWALDGSGFHDYVLSKRADVGIASRNGVCVSGRLVYICSMDGVRVIAPNFAADDNFATWVISEPVSDIYSAIPSETARKTAMVVDRRGRVIISHGVSGGTNNTNALVFDPNIPGAVDDGGGQNRNRPGWCRYSTGHGFHSGVRLKSGVFSASYKDIGQVVVVDHTTAKLRFLGWSPMGVSLTSDDGAAIPWIWKTPTDTTVSGSILETLAYIIEGSGSHAITLTSYREGVSRATYSKTILSGGGNRDIIRAVLADRGSRPSVGITGSSVSDFTLYSLEVLGNITLR